MSSADGKWLCSTCRKRFNTEKGAKQHIASYHPKKGGTARFEPKPDEELREWEYMHLSRGWPI